MSKKALRYRAGVDVGQYSVGLTAIEIDDSSDNPYEAMPLRTLSIMSVTHDGAIDPSARDSADSRKAVSGAARRSRRLFEQRRFRYQELDKCLAKWEYPVARAADMIAGLHDSDPYLPWHARINLLEGYIEDEQKRKLSLAIALRHIARHRGWRNPYSSVCSLKELALVASSFYMEFFNKQQQWVFAQEGKLFDGVTGSCSEDGTCVLEGVPAWDGTGCVLERPTIAQLIEPLLNSQIQCRFRRNPPADVERSEFLHVGKLHQSDNYYELLKMFEIQKVPQQEQDELFNAVFYQINPKDVGAAANLVAKDDLQPSKIRASKASLAFQRYRILTTLGNLRIKDGKSKRMLLPEERVKLYRYLVSEEVSRQGSDVTWHDVSQQLGIERCDLVGVGGQTADGTPISAKQPPYLSTEHIILTSKDIGKQLKPLREWWESADELSKEFLIELLGNAGVSSIGLSQAEAMAKQQVDTLMADLGSMGEDALSCLEKIKLASGRASYSIDTLERLNRRMLDEGLDLFDARKVEFGVKNDWKPKPEPLGSPTGSPAVDRTIKIVARWLKACEREWGKPETIAIEHVREGFRSEKQKRDDRSAMDRRYRANNVIREEITKALGEVLGSGVTGVEAIRHADIRRWQAIQRQNGQCLYCGTGIDYYSAQMDHIVPRKGVGCSNELSNLVAVCADCNTSKSNVLFHVWAQGGQEKDAIDRVKQWNRDSYFTSSKQFNTFKNDVIARLRQKEEDDPLDVRSIESVAWMARELREQIVGHFGYEGVTTTASSGNDPFALQRVQVFKGWITSEARKASGLEKALPWTGSYAQKTRLDRRHHAVDAAVIALMRPGVAKTLIEREALRRELRDEGRQAEKGSREDWKAYRGFTHDDTVLYDFWRNCQMQRLKDILIEDMHNDRIPIEIPLRLRLGIGQAHKKRIFPLHKKRVGDALSNCAIDRAETPALWMALVNHPDFDRKTGLPEDASRRIRIHDKWLDATDDIRFMAANEKELNQVISAVRMRVRGGYAEIGGAIHHVRFYRIPKYNSKGKQTSWIFASLRVLQIDLVKFKKEDLFRVTLPLSSISVRSAIAGLRDALYDGRAEYLGWVVVGDEVVVDKSTALFSCEGSQKINKFIKAFPGITRFTLTGFSTNAKLTLTPRSVASEGIPEIDWSEDCTMDDMARRQDEVSRVYGDHGWTKEDIKEINLVIKKGCHLSVDKVLSTQPVFVRRDALGRMRSKSNNNMPITWNAFSHPPL
ncbi:MAG: HNH endonuclease [Gordonibacter sp.]